MTTSKAHAYQGREIEVRPASMKYGPPFFRVGAGDWMQGSGGESPADLLKKVRATIDDMDSRPVQANAYRWWYRPGDVETCKRSAGRLNEHHKGRGMACTAPECVKAVRIEQQRAKRRTGLTATAVSRVLGKAGLLRAELRSDGTAKGEGFKAQGEDRNRRVAVLWCGGEAPAGEGLPENLRACAGVLAGAGYPVRRTPHGAALWIFPKGFEPAEGLPLEEEEFEAEEAEDFAEESGFWLPVDPVLGQLELLAEDEEQEPKPGAERWDICRVRAVLAEKFEEAYGGRDGWYVGPEMWDVMVTRQQGNAITRPRGAAGERWDIAMQRYIVHLTAAGLEVVRKNRHCIVVRVPQPAKPQTTARVFHAGELGGFTYAVTFDGFPSIGGTLVFHTAGIGASGYTVTDHEGTTVNVGRSDRNGAVERLAHHYGLPVPVRVLEE
ncbi:MULTISPECIES: hypothetical protein [Streptomyces]|uniref:hypothetical protein n=1 Tax=Streptomyces TaxID=1883 RepID=UPI00345C4B97